MRGTATLWQRSRHVGVRSGQPCKGFTRNVRYRNLPRTEDLRVTTAALLAAWREATRAAEEAARLARLAEAAADRADVDADAAAEIAELVQKAVEAAQRAATRAQAAADRATALAASLRNPGVGDARHAAEDASAAETTARDQYHEAESEARGVESPRTSPTSADLSRT